MKNQKIVALVEPSFYGVMFAKAAFDMGCKVISIASSKDNPKKYGYEGIYYDLIVADIRDVESLYEAIKNSVYVDKLDALIPATDYASHITAKVAERLGLKGIPYEAALKSRNKDLARNTYERKGIPSAKYRKVKTKDEALKGAEEIGYPVVLKPTNAASSQNVFFINNPNELKNAMDKMFEFKITYMNFEVRDEYLVEEYIDGQEFSVEIFLKEGDVLFATVTEKTTSALPYFVEIIHTLPTSIYTDRQKEIIDTAASAMKSLGIINGPSHVEVKLSKEGPKIIEVNGRPGGDNISSDLLIHALGINIFRATVEYYLDLPIVIKPSRNKAAAIAYLTADREGIVSSIQGIEQLDKGEDLVRSDITVRPGDHVVTAKSSDDRLGYVITCADTPNEAKKSATELIRSIKLIY